MCNHLIINLLSLPQEKKRREAYEEFLKEKLMIDEIVRKIYEEDQRYIFWHSTLKLSVKKLNSHSLSTQYNNFSY